MTECANSFTRDRNIARANAVETIAAAMNGTSSADIRLALSTVWDAGYIYGFDSRFEEIIALRALLDDISSMIVARHHDRKK